MLNGRAIIDMYRALMNQFVDAIEIRSGTNKACHYVGLSNNGEVLFTSEVFDSRNNCLRAAADLSDDFIEEVPVIFTAAPEAAATEVVEPSPATRKRH